MSAFFLFVGIYAVLELELDDFFLAFVHLLVEGFEGGFEHGDCVFEGLFCLIDGVFDEYSSDNFPAFAFSLEGV